MDFQTILFVFGAILFLAGLIGHIKAKEIEIGSTSKVVRVILFIVGIVFIILSFVYPFEDTKSNLWGKELLPSDTKEQDTPINDKRVADATYLYWEKCEENDDFYRKKLDKEDSILQISTLRNTKRGEALLRYANFIREYCRSEENLSTKDVDPELVAYYKQLRALNNQRANHYEQIGGMIQNLGDSPDATAINDVTQRIDDVQSKDERLSLKIDQHNIEKELLIERLSSKYGRKFVDRGS